MPLAMTSSGILIFKTIMTLSKLIQILVSSSP